jgi:hypothetical protein
VEAGELDGENGGQGKRRWRYGLDVDAWSGHHRSNSAAVRRAPHGLLFVQNFQNRFKFANLKQMLFIAPKNFKFCVRLYWSILNIFFNCANFKFSTEILLKFLEQIQYLNLL